MSEPVVYLNGEYVALSDAKISILDQGFLLGDGVFDVVSVWKGVLFKLDEHIERLFLSLRATGLSSTLDADGWREVVIETVRRCELDDASQHRLAVFACG